MFDLWPLPSGRRRPSVRIGFPWFAGFCAWAGAGRLAVDWPLLRTEGAMAWLAWLAIGTVGLPVAVALGSRLVDVRLDGRAFLLCAAASAVATVLALLVLFRAFPAFAVLGGFVVPLVTAAAYAFATARGLEAWRDAKGR